MKKKLITVLLSCTVSFSMLGTTVFAHTERSNVQYSAAETHWDIFEDTGNGGTTKHSSGNGIYVKETSSFSNSSCFSNLSSCVTHAVDKWSNALFNNKYLFSGKIKKVAASYALTNSDIKAEKTLVEIVAVNDVNATYWGSTRLAEATCYDATDSGKHLKVCQVFLNEATLGQKTTTKQTYTNYTLTHELGHIIGLADLSSSFDDGTFSKYLMGYNNWTMQEPTASDIKGAAVISGYHNTHSNFNRDFYDNSYHKESCGLCDGYNLEKHSVSKGKCTVCNHIVASPTDTWKVVDGPLNVRQTASTSAYSYGTIANGTTFKINDIKQSGNYILAKIASVSTLGSGSTCSSANAVGHWVAIEYCSVV